MRVVSNLQWPDTPFRRHGRLFGRERRCLVGVDVEWTKNYRIKNGSRPFCYSIAVIPLPDAPSTLEALSLSFGYKSVYVDRTEDEQLLIAAADADLIAAIEAQQIIVGHQLTSDLGVLAAASASSTPGVDAVIRRWHARHDDCAGEVIDTRYDIDGLVTERSRRLVDVCRELHLGVLQPEIRGSMTKVHRQFLDTGEELFREKLIVLNLRHTLASCLIALLALRLAEPRPLDVNQLLIDELWDQLDYVSSGTLESLLAQSSVA